MSTDPFDALFGRFRPGRFAAQADPNWIPQERIIGGDVIEPTGYVADGVVSDTSFADTVDPVLVRTTATLTDADAANYPNRVAFNTDDVKLYRSDGSTWSKAVDGADLVANSVTAGSLSAVLVLASIIRTANTGNKRVEITSDGVILYDASDNILVRIPTSDLPVYVAGEIEASSLVSTATAEFQGTASLARGGVMTVEAGVAKPSAAPVLAQAAVSSVSLDDTHYVSDYGLAWDSGAGTWWGANGSGSTILLREYNATTGATIRTKDTGLSTSTYSIDGVAVSGSYVYLGASNGTTAKVYKYARADLAAGSPASFTVSVADPYRWVIFWEASSSRIVVVTTTGTGASVQLRFRKYNESGSLQSTTDATGYAVDGSGVNFFGAVTDGTYYWVKVYNSSSDKYVRCWTAAGAYQSNREFGLLGTTDLVSTGLGYDGSSLFGLRVASGVATVSEFSDWDWTTESSKYWVGYSWYDSAGTAHKTEVGPRASITMYRRLALTVQNAAIPTGGADDPDKVRVYMARNATEPAAGSYKLQVTDALTSRVLSTFATGGAADATSNDFPGGTPAEIASSTAGWSLQGDGTASFDALSASGAISAAGGIDSVPLTGSDTSFSVTNDGTATYSDRTCEYVKIGRLVVFHLSFTLSGSGSGSGAIAIDSEDTGLPKASPSSFAVVGDRSGTGVNRLSARAVNGTNQLTLQQIRLLTSTTALTGADLVSGAAYHFMGAYIAAS